MTSSAMSQGFVDTRSHDIVDMVSHDFVDAPPVAVCDGRRHDERFSKTGQVLVDDAVARAADQSIVEVTRANRQVYYQGLHVSLPSTFAGREFYRTITDTEFLLSDPVTGEIVFSFPLPMVALQVRGRYVASYAIRGVQISFASKYWKRKLAEHRAQFDLREQN